MPREISRFAKTRPAIRGAYFALPFLTTFTASAFANEVVPFAPHNCLYVRCSDEPSSNGETGVQPISLRGKTLSYYDHSINSNIQQRYFPSMKRFPNLESCVESSNPTTLLLEEATLKWKAFGSEEAVSVCIFRLFHAMRDPDLAATWLSSSKFVDVRNLPGEQETSFYYSDETHGRNDVRVVSAYWPTAENGRLFRSLLSSLLDSAFSLGTIIYAVFDDEGNVLHIQMASKERYPH